MDGRLRRLVVERSRGYCEHCGWPLGGAVEVHHRLPGGMGGTGRDRDAASNLLALLPRHHNLMPGSVHMTPARSKAAGWLISTADVRLPSEVPVMLWGKEWVLLDEAGGMRKAPPPNGGSMAGPAPDSVAAG